MKKNWSKNAWIAVCLTSKINIRWRRTPHFNAQIVIKTRNPIIGNVQLECRKISPTQALTIPVNVSQTLNVPISSQVRKTASSSIAGISYTDVVAGKSNSNGNIPNNRTNVPQAEVSKISTRIFSANIAPENDLGDVTPENLEFLQNLLFELI